VIEARCREQLQALEVLGSLRDANADDNPGT
jgi:hypothetical protein